MADLSLYPDSNAPKEDAPAYPGTPRWVKVFGIIALAVVLLFGLMTLSSGGDHGPGRHMPSGGGPGIQTPASSITQGDGGGGDTPPTGGHPPS